MGYLGQMPIRRGRPSLRTAFSEDHYYWLTSYFAARGLQAATCRIIAVTMFGLSTIPLILMFSDAGPMGFVDRSIAVAVSACSAVMALLWLRHSWPTRLQSIACVSGGSVCIAIACLIESEPALGLMGTSAFITLSAFAALFHDLRVVSVTWAIGIITLVVLATRLGGVDPAITAGGIALFVLTNVFVVVVCRSVIGLVDRDFHYSELEPLTGLLTRDAFSDRVATLFAARDRTDDRFAAVLVVSLDSFSLLTAMSGDGGANRARVAVGHRIGETLRRDAVLAHIGESEYLIADTFTGADASVLSERLQQTVVTAPFRLSASIGAVTTPLGPLAGLPPHDVVDELITIATSNMYTARRAGGQRTVATACPQLSSTEADDLDGTA
jgi:diguanylate cyclase (GGDEF)-like protein